MMYKKYFLSVMMVCLLFFWLSKANVQDVTIRYCEDGDNRKADLSKLYVVQPWEAKKICINVASDAKKTVQVTYGFPNPILNSQWERTCSQDMSANNSFSKFFVQTGERKIIIEPGKTYTINESFFPPLWMSGDVKWCFAYMLSQLENEKEEWQMFNVITRKVYFLDFFVGWAANINSKIKLLRNPGGEYTTDSKIKATLDKNGKLSLWFKIINNGNIAQNVTMSGSIYNVLWFEKTYTAPVTNVNPWETKDIIINVWVIPAYKWLFNIEYTLANTPLFSFDTSNIDQTLKNWDIETFTASIFLFSWVVVILLAIILMIILYKIIRHKKKTTV